MRIPKEIEKELNKRADAASEFLAADSVIANWLYKNDIVVDECHINTGAESLVNPYASIEIIKSAIAEKE